MPNFIYVFGEAARDKMLKSGYTLLKHDAAQSLYIFRNTPDLRFDLQPEDFVFSDILTFT